MEMAHPSAWKGEAPPTLGLGLPSRVEEPGLCLRGQETWVGGLGGKWGRNIVLASDNLEIEVLKPLGKSLPMPGAQCSPCEGCCLGGALGIGGTSGPLGNQAPPLNILSGGGSGWVLAPRSLP